MNQDLEEILGKKETLIVLILPPLHHQINFRNPPWIHFSYHESTEDCENYF